MGCAGLTLSADERDFFADVKPWGFILFKRNVDTPDQVRALVDSFREVVGRSDAPVLIDQEGGRVQRQQQVEHRVGRQGQAERDRSVARGSIGALGLEDGLIAWGTRKRRRARLGRHGAHRAAVRNA